MKRVSGLRCTTPKRECYKRDFGFPLNPSREMCLKPFIRRSITALQGDERIGAPIDITTPASDFYLTRGLNSTLPN